MKMQLDIGPFYNAASVTNFLVQAGLGFALNKGSIAGAKIMSYDGTARLGTMLWFASGIKCRFDCTKVPPGGYDLLRSTFANAEGKPLR